MEQQRRLPVGQSGGRHIYVSHAQILALDSDREETHRVGIGEVLQRDAQGLRVRRLG
jgi:hypothetical protein